MQAAPQSHSAGAFGKVGIWSVGLRYGDPDLAADAASELEDLGYSAIWLPDAGGDVFGAIANLLRPTSALTVATGILNVWIHDAADVAAQHANLIRVHGPRFLLGIGVSHQPFVDRVRQPGVYERPLAKMSAFLDALDEADPPLSKDSRVLAALGPRMLDLAAARAAGVHSFLVTPEHTHIVREALSAESLVAVEQGVIFETDRSRARAIARKGLSSFLALPNYVNNLRRLGLDDDDFADGGSDRLIDALVAWGDDAAIADRVKQHHDAGANHVCIQVMTDNDALPRREWRALAPALT